MKKKNIKTKKPTVFAIRQRNQRCKKSWILCRLGDTIASVQFGWVLVIGSITERMCFVSSSRAEVSKTVGFLCRLIVAGPVSAPWSSVTVNVLFDNDADGGAQFLAISTTSQLKPFI